MHDTRDTSSPNEKPKKLTLDVVKNHMQKGLERTQDPKYHNDPYKGLNANERDKQVIDDFVAALRRWQAKAQESGNPQASIHDLQAEQEAWMRDASQKQ